MNVLQAALMVLLIGNGIARAADAPTADDRSCVDVTFENQRFYDCINRRLARAVPDHRDIAQPTYGIDKPANQLGAYDQAANKQRLGSNYGKSVYAQRPAAPVFANGLTRTR